jgi:hypothetical protein
VPCSFSCSSLAEQQEILDAEASCDLRGVRHDEYLPAPAHYLHQHFSALRLPKGLKGLLRLLESPNGHEACRGRQTKQDSNEDQTLGPPALPGERDRHVAGGWERQSESLEQRPPRDVPHLERSEFPTAEQP